MKKLFLLSAFVLTMTGLYGQSYIKARAIVTDPNSCNNTVVCEFYNLEYPNFVKQGLFGPNVQEQDTLENFCFYEAGSGSNNTIDAFSSNGYLSAYQIYSGLILPDFDYTVSSYVAPTGYTSQDGSFVVQFDSAVTAFNITVFQDGYTPSFSTPDAYTLNITNLNEGYVTINIQDPSDVYNYADFRVYAGELNSFYLETGMDVGVSFQHATSSCTGWITLQATPPGTYYNNWSDGTYNTIARTDLCPGLYGVYSYNSDGGVTTQGHIDTVVIVDNGLTTIDSNLYSAIPQDTSYYFFEDCLYDYALPIDSVQYFEDTVFYSDPLLIATYDMIVYQGNNAITFSDSLITLADSTVLLDVVIYCQQFKSQFMGERLMFLRGADNHYFGSPSLNVTTAEAETMSTVFPNPVLDRLTVSLPGYINSHVQIVDYQGNLVYAAENLNTEMLQIDMERFASGLYLLLIYSENGVEQHRFVKQ